LLAAKSTSRARIVVAALNAAMPLRSAPDEAAVADVLGTLSVRVEVTRTLSIGTAKTSATTCATFTISPWPISVPPWLSWIEPSA
jgi:hypothetical protein